MIPARIPPAEALFLGESLAPLMDEIEQALAETHPSLCERVRQALADDAPQARAVANRMEAA